MVHHELIIPNFHWMILILASFSPLELHPHPQDRMVVSPMERTKRARKNPASSSSGDGAAVVVGLQRTRGSAAIIMNEIHYDLL